MSKRRRAIDPIAEYTARANRPGHRSIGAPPPELGIEPSAHPVYLKRDMVVFLLIGFTCLHVTLLLTWAATRTHFEWGHPGPDHVWHHHRDRTAGWFCKLARLTSTLTEVPNQ
jgi:hypothetical protein